MPPNTGPAGSVKPSVAETLSKSGELVDSPFLVRNGIPFDVAFSLDSDMRLAFCIILGELGGRGCNWDKMAWEPPQR